MVLFIFVLFMVYIMISHIKVDTSQINADNCTNYSDPTWESCEIESTFDDRNRDRDLSRSDSDSSDENSEVWDFIYKSGLSYYRSFISDKKEEIRHSTKDSKKYNEIWAGVC